MVVYIVSVKHVCGAKYGETVMVKALCHKPTKDECHQALVDWCEKRVSFSDYDDEEMWREDIARMADRFELLEPVMVSIDN